MRTMMRVCGVLVFCSVVMLNAQQPALSTHELSIKYTRDSEEYSALTRQVFRIAESSVERLAAGLPKGAWAVILDIDETALDNSTYQLERAAYGLPYEPASFSAWVVRREAGAVPGATQFVEKVRRLGGKIAWISNREATTTGSTRENMIAQKLWNEDDLLCLQNNSANTKKMRRAEVRSGQGKCSWPGKKVTVLAFIGDQMGDFPDAEEAIPNTGTDSAFGRTCFLLPNAMYGQWVGRVTRKER